MRRLVNCAGALKRQKKKVRGKIPQLARRQSSEKKDRKWKYVNALLKKKKRKQKHEKRKKKRQLKKKIVAMYVHLSRYTQKKKGKICTAFFWSSSLEIDQKKKKVTLENTVLRSGTVYDEKSTSYKPVRKTGTKRKRKTMTVHLFKKTRLKGGFLLTYLRSRMCSCTGVAFCLFPLTEQS